MPALQVRVSDEEYGMCREKAEAECLSLSEWVRRRLLDPPDGSRVVVPPREPVNAPSARPSKGKKRKSAGKLIAAFEALNPIPPKVQALAEELGPAMVEDASLVLTTYPLTGLPRVARDVPEFAELPEDEICTWCEENPCVCESLKEAKADKIEAAIAVLATQEPNDVPPTRPKPLVSPKCSAPNDRCRRFGTPACDACRKLNAVAPEIPEDL